MRVGEPVYKKTFTKPLPDGAKVFSRKHIKYARFKDVQGTTQEERLSKDGKKILCDTQHYYIRFDDHNSIRRVLKAYADKGASKYLYERIKDLIKCKREDRAIDTKLQEYLEQDAQIRRQLVGFGLLKIEDKPEAEMLEGLIEKFAEHIRLKERSQGHINEVMRTLRAVFIDCNFRTWDNIDSDVIKMSLDERRDGGGGISKARYNNIVRLVQHFCRWHTKKLRKTDKAVISPVEDLETLEDVQTDKRHQRRTLELEDYRRFLFAAMTGDDYKGLSGKERNFLYRFGAETAMRRIDFMRLRVKDIDFDNNLIQIQAKRIKNKTESVICLKPETAIELKQHCRNKFPDAKVFNMPQNTSAMVKFDLAGTAIKDSSDKVLVPAIPYEDNFGRVFDFHAACRYQSIALAALNPDTPEIVRQKMSRHKDPAMLRYYAGAAETERQQRKALEAFPDLTQIPQTQAQIKTGTDNLSNACFIDGTIRLNTVQYEKNEKNRPALSAKDSDIKPPVGANNNDVGLCETSVNSENPHFLANNNDTPDELVLNKFYEPDFDPDLANLVKVWPDLPEHIKAAIKALVQTHIKENK
ncbi:MAG: tyrosine-type recombinase/integrase [Planctomycetota bacterium]|jgi:integrase